jgi:threonine dehydrogenase-like Zn-dependent dehydrogenase
MPELTQKQQLDALFGVLGAKDFEAAQAALGECIHSAQLAGVAATWMKPVFGLLGITEGAAAIPAIQALVHRAQNAETQLTGILRGVGATDFEGALKLIDKQNLDVSAARSTIARLESERRSVEQLTAERMGARGIKPLHKVDGAGLEAGGDDVPHTFNEFINGYNDLVKAGKSDEASTFYASYSALLTKE